MKPLTIPARPMLFSGPMVRAILAGRKSQTRRLISEPHDSGIELGDDGAFAFMHAPSCGGGCDYACAAAGEVLPDHIGYSPYGRAGRWKQLWVQETFAVAREFDRFRPSRIPRRGRSRIWYLADGPKPPWAGKTRVGRFMSRWASRLTLQVIRVRVERIRDITQADAIAEGMEPGLGQNSALQRFIDLWRSLNKGRGYEWHSNPWVWVIEFAHRNERRIPYENGRPRARAARSVRRGLSVLP